MCVYVMRFGCVRGGEREDYGNSSLNYSLKVLTWSELALLCVCACVCVTSKLAYEFMLVSNMLEMGNN